MEERCKVRKDDGAESCDLIRVGSGVLYRERFRVGVADSPRRKELKVGKDPEEEEKSGLQRVGSFGNKKSLRLNHWLEII